MLAASAAMIMENDRRRNDDDDPDFWADSESDFELSNFDPELGPRAAETWKCVNCGCANTPFIRYCSRCWEVRERERCNIIYM